MKLTYFTNSSYTEKELKTHYHTLVKKYHPDVNEKDTTEILKIINAEYVYLKQFVKNNNTYTSVKYNYNESSTFNSFNNYADRSNREYSKKQYEDLRNSMYELKKQYQENLRQRQFKEREIQLALEKAKEEERLRQRKIRRVRRKEQRHAEIQAEPMTSAIKLTVVYVISFIILLAISTIYLLNK